MSTQTEIELHESGARKRPFGREALLGGGILGACVLACSFPLIVGAAAGIGIGLTALGVAAPIAILATVALLGMVWLRRRAGPTVCGCGCSGGC